VSVRPWRVPEVWLVAASLVLVWLWLSQDWPNWGVPLGVYGVACVLLGRHAERERRIHRRLKASIRQRPIPVVHAPTEMNMRRIPAARRPDLTGR
jgi:hypothetical protein